MYEVSARLLCVVWQFINAFTSKFSSGELEYFSNGNGNTACLLDEKAWEFVDALGFRCDGCLMTRTLLTGPAQEQKPRVVTSPANKREHRVGRSREQKNLYQLKLK